MQEPKGAGIRAVILHTRKWWGGGKAGRERYRAGMGRLGLGGGGISGVGAQRILFPLPGLKSQQGSKQTYASELAGAGPGIPFAMAGAFQMARGQVSLKGISSLLNS